MEDIVNEAALRMGKAIGFLKTDIASIRTNKVAASMLENLTIAVYNGTTKLRILELATVTTIDPQTLQLVPYDQAVVEEIAKGIMQVNIGATVIVDLPKILVKFPPLSLERRKELVKFLHQKIEGGKVMIRQIRHDLMSKTKRLFEAKEIGEDELIRLENALQRTTDLKMTEITSLSDKKENELMSL